MVNADCKLTGNCMVASKLRHIDYWIECLVWNYMNYGPLWTIEFGYVEVYLMFIMCMCTLYLHIINVKYVKLLYCKIGFTPYSLIREYWKIIRIHGCQKTFVTSLAVKCIVEEN